MKQSNDNYSPALLTDGLVFGESPRWRDGDLYISDMLGKKVYKIDSAGNKSVISEMPNKPNGLGFTPDGEMILSSMLDTKLYKWRNGGLELYADLSEIYTGYIGDMVIDKNGRIYVDDVGARVFEGEGLKPGRIVIVEPNGEVKIGLDNCNFPNGIVISNDGKTLFFVETFEERINACDIVDGTIQNRRIIFDMKKYFSSEDDRVKKRGCIDGITIDKEDGLWLSMLKAEQFIRINQNGVITDRIHMDGYECIACTLGGEDGRTLFMAATEVDGDNIFEAMVNLRTKTSVFTTRVEIGKGLGRP